VALAVLILTVASACSDDDKPSASSSPSQQVSPQSSASSAAPTTSTASAGPCDAAAPPATAVHVTHADGDFNGDGSADTLTVYGTGTDEQPAPYRVQVELAGGLGRVDDAIADAATDSSSNVKALGGAEISAGAGLPPDGSGEEIFVEVGSGASDALVGVFQLVGCTLTRITGPVGTERSQFAVGGSVTHLDGLRCDGSAGGQRLVQLSAKSDDGITYETQETRLVIEQGHFTVPNPPVTGTLPATDERLQPFSTLSCPGVAAP
jgi:hypothetical protein